MNVQIIREKLKTENILESKIQKYTLLIDEKMIEQGALFFVPVGNREIKIVLSAPFHQDFLKDEIEVTYKNLLQRKDIIILT